MLLPWPPSFGLRVYRSLSTSVAVASAGRELPDSASVGIYPTLIIVLVALDKSEIEKQSPAYSIPVARALQSSPVQVEVTTDVVCAADANLNVQMRPHSVILIGPPLPLNRSSATATLSDVASEDGVERSKIPTSPAYRESSL